MAKGQQITQKDLMIWTMHHPNGTKVYYLIKKEPFLKEGFKEAVHLPGTTGDSVFRYREDAEAALLRFPPGEEAGAGDAAAPAETGGGDGATESAQA